MERRSGEKPTETGVIKAYLREDIGLEEAAAALAVMREAEDARPLTSSPAEIAASGQALVQALHNLNLPTASDLDNRTRKVITDATSVVPVLEEKLRGEVGAAATLTPTLAVSRPPRPPLKVHTSYQGSLTALARRINRVILYGVVIVAAPATVYYGIQGGTVLSTAVVSTNSKEKGAETRSSDAQRHTYYEQSIIEQLEVFRKLNLRDSYPLRQISLTSAVRPGAEEMVKFTWERTVGEEVEIVISTVPLSKAKFLKRIDEPTKISTVQFDIAEPAEFMVGNEVLGYSIRQFSSPNEVMKHRGFRAAQFTLSEYDLRKFGF